MKLLFGLFVFGAAAFAQSSHSVTLSWTDTLNPSATTYNVYRASGLCSGSPAFTQVATSVNAKTYQDTTVTIGNYCYGITATLSGAESAKSPLVNPSVVPFAPQGLSVTNVAELQKIDVVVGE